MSIRHAVRRDREVIAGIRQLLLVRIGAGLHHQVGNRVWIVGCGNCRERQRHRDALAGLHQAGSRRAFLVGDEVQRAALVVLAPAPPVAQLLETALSRPKASVCPP